MSAFDVRSDIRELERQKAIEALTVILRKGDIPHALVFQGLEGTGKRMAATVFAMACNCTNMADRLSEPDGLLRVAECNCRSCNKIRSGNHPDIHRVEPSGTAIKIEQIRELCDTLSMKPYEAKVRAAIISPASAMTTEAANAFLKMLEEPPERTILLLTAERKSDLLPTILSRCQPVRFNPMPRDVVEAILEEKYDLPPDAAAVLAAMAGGSMAKIRAAGDAGALGTWVRQRGWLLRVCTQLMARGRGRLSPGTVLAFAERLAKDRENLMGHLETLKSWLRDLIMSKYGEGNVINKDMTAYIQTISQRFTADTLLSGIEAIQSAERDLRQTNVNPRLTLEVMAMRFSR